MEKRQLRNSTAKTDEWIKCQSKQRPGQYYMFNKGTGETKWCGEFKDDLPLNKSNDNKKPASLPKNISKYNHYHKEIYTILNTLFGYRYKIHTNTSAGSS